MASSIFARALRPSRALLATMGRCRWLATESASTTFLPRDAVTDRVLDVTRHFPKVQASQVNASSNFIKDLGLDSLDQVELVMALEDEFAIEIPDDEAERITTVEDAVRYIASHPMAK
ncbi:Acyl carrier protein [Plasmodiophora brassicae]|uniref:Acyl carrier protein n=1 Tax=Plasmodiophora brassicae TaxID=37360 RepID=A0A0G4IP27_PLABS|nr:hypothetical protein PBRA_005536 [Plasmodiophora brassicae]SPR01881.1 unnamed protein product [Plasmodiophora brassicae]